MHDAGVPRLGFWAFSATAIFSALAIGAGELVFWPSLVLAHGPSVIWLGIGAVILQWFINVEIARTTLLSGQKLGSHVAQRSRLIGLLLGLGATIPWIWPGWVLGGAQFVAALNYGPEKPIAVAILGLSVLLLLGPRNRYRWLAVVQSIGLGLLLLGVVIVFVYVLWRFGGLGLFSARLVTEAGFLRPIASLGQPDDVAFFTLLGGIVFAGAGGIMNLGYGYLLIERGGIAPPTEARHLGAWMRLVRIEHGLLFALANSLTMCFIAAMLWMTFAGVAPQGGGVALVGAAHQILSQDNPAIGACFALAGFLVFWTSAVGVLDFSSKIAADIAAALTGLSEARLYSGLVIGQAILSTLILFSPISQPFWLMVISAVLNTGVMAIYCGFLVWNNATQLPPWARPHPGVQVILLLACLLYACLLVLAVARMGS